MSRSAGVRVPGGLLWNFIQFQLGWFALVLSAGAGVPLLGMAATVMLVLVHLRWFALEKEFVLLAAVGLIGWMWESLIYTTEFLDYPNWYANLLVAPPWMALLWVNFAATLNHSLAWLKGQPLMAALLGATGGPLAFWAGAQLGAVHFVDEVWALVILSGGWLVLLPAVVEMSRQLCGERPRNQGEPVVVS